MWMISDDAPVGNYGEMRQAGMMDCNYFTRSIRNGAMKLNSMTLHIQYSCCFGVEIVMSNGAIKRCNIWCCPICEQVI
jgi:MFS transporter, NNP family, nitrate/nitrite transporter